jgi:hypothetical protein
MGLIKPKRAVFTKMKIVKYEKPLLEYLEYEE